MIRSFFGISLIEDAYLQSRFIVTPRSNRRPLKIRHVLRKTEEEVAQPDLVAWIQRGIADQRKIDLANAAIDPTIVAQVDRTTTYIPIPAEPTGQVEPDIQILLPADEEKKKTKTRHSTKVSGQGDGRWAVAL